MKIAIASSGKWLESFVDSHTGRAPFFVVYDTDEESYDVIDNSFCLRCLHWAGAQTATILTNTPVDVIVVYRIGPCAYRWFHNAKVPIYHTERTSVVRAVRCFREGMLQTINAPNCKGHSHIISSNRIVS